MYLYSFCYFAFVIYEGNLSQNDTIAVLEEVTKRQKRLQLARNMLTQCHLDIF